jgi:Arc/MetJ-type ribon-helix-helix transcriptional regulator
LKISLNPEVQKLIDEIAKSGKYATLEDVLAAAIVTLEQHERQGEFDPGELDELLAKGEQSLVQEGPLDGAQAFKLRRERRAQTRDQAP